MQLSVASHDTVAPNARATLQLNWKLQVDSCSLQSLLPYKQPAEGFAILEHVRLLSACKHITIRYSRGICRPDWQTTAFVNRSVVYVVSIQGLGRGRVGRHAPCSAGGREADC